MHEYRGATRGAAWETRRNAAREARTTPPRRRAGRRLRVGLGAVLTVALAAGCAGPGGSGVRRGGAAPADAEAPPRLEIPRAGTRSDRAPAWASRPLTEDKLEDLEVWLAGEGLGYQDYWLLEGELQLAEGRVQLARRAAVPGLGSSALARVRGGLEHVRDHAAATVAQRQRAEMGLRALDGPAAIPASSATFSGVLPRSAWGAQPANPRRMDPATDSWRWITVHHSAMPDAPRPDGTLATSARAIREIQAAHMNGRGFGDVGYHFFIDASGRVFTGRELRYQGAHADGDNNRGNVGICLIGNFEQERPTRAALAALDGLIAKLAERYGIPSRQVKPHGYWKNTACPGRHLAAHLAKYR